MNRDWNLEWCFAIAIRRARQRAGLSARELSAQLEELPNFISRIERLHRRLMANEINLIEQLLGCSDGELYGEGLRLHAAGERCPQAVRRRLKTAR